MSDIPMFNRDLSWLTFNNRVLIEAQDKNVPLIERLRFMAIYSSNLDEFFSVRVSEMRRLKAIGKKKINNALPLAPDQMLNRVHDVIQDQLKYYGEGLGELYDELSKEGIFINRDSKHIPASFRKEIDHYFKTKVLAFLQPQFLKKKSKPFLNNKELYFAVRLKKNTKEKIAVVNIPSDILPRFYKIKEENGLFKFLFLDDIIRVNLDKVFPDYDILERVSIKLNKDADLHIDDEYSGDLVEKIEKQISKRNLGTPSRFLYDQNISESLLAMLIASLKLDQDDLVPGGRYHNLNDYFQIPNPVGSHLEYPDQRPCHHQVIDRFPSIFKAIEDRDQVLHFPYQSYEYILQFFNEAAIDPDVKEINVTFYRMASDSIIGNALISAAKNGKKVFVFMEVKARFDEENNLRWANKMEQAGVIIKFSLPGLKVHAKVGLVRKEKDGKRTYYGFFGTGNLNEKTARIYCDHGLLTTHEGMTTELAGVFDFLHKKGGPEKFEHLIVSQFDALGGFSQLIDREIVAAKTGKEAHIIIKLNNLEEPNLIAKIYEAAKAGVKVDMIVRSICCLVPGTSGIKVTRIVDRYLEHARMFYFYNEGKKSLYMGSADWMSRNIHRRVEVTFPVYDEAVKSQLLHILDLQLKDNQKAVWLDEGMENVRKEETTEKIRAQEATYVFVKDL